MTRFVKLLTKQRETLKELFRNHPKHRTRARGHMLLLSDDGFQIDEIARIYNLDRDTISQCYNNWADVGIVGLFDNAKSGRPKALSESEIERGRQLLEEDPRSSKYAQSRMQEECGRTVSESTFKRAMKQTGLRWKRMRKSLRKKRNQEAFEQAEREIDELHTREDAGELHVYYYDESGVSLTPSVPYGWQPKNETYELPSSRSKRINLLGFCNRHNDYHMTTVIGTVASEQVIACFDQFSSTLTKPTVVIIDNASVHTSEAFSNRLARWAKNGLFVKYLPTYSPELNLIEIVWRFFKYQWLPLSAYQSFKTLKYAVSRVISRLGTEYLISFA